MTYAELVGVAVLGLSTLVSGAALLARSRAVLPGAPLALGGLALLTGALAWRAEPELARAAFVTGGSLLLPLAVTAYPRLRWRLPVDFVALVVVTGSGLIAVASLGWTGPWERSGILWPTGITLAATGFLHTWWKLERSDGTDRWALAWMALSLALTGTVFFFIVFALDGATGQRAGIGYGVGYGLFAVVAPAMYVGLWRPEVVDVRGLVVQAVVLATAVVVYMAVYATLQGGLDLLGGEPPSVGTMALAAALIAALFHPLQVAMRGVIDELLFGTRPDPFGAAGHVAENLGDDPELALRTIREALVLPYAELQVGGEVLATSGTAVTHTRALPLTLGDGRTGELVVGLRAGDLALTAGDRHVLDLARPLLAQSLRARLLADQLQESREQTITAIEEERRRLRRDLHDGLGPRLSGIAFTSDAARNTMPDDPPAAAALLGGLRAEAVAAIEEIRQLVYGMRPPALDELGLVPALRQQAHSLRTADGRPLRVEVDAADLPPLAAAVEVAAYRIAVEALSNAARHSGADLAEASLRVAEGSLVVEVNDHGATPSTWTRGVGLSSMRERAAELGGSLDAGYADGGGRVVAVLPL
ncbi:sensor histidine kinase [Nocardioides speluncae]|uniref:sensor histidine kinase n=1 Tax=Nocardioides speluncae TaxID=2670337 RepID=UPI000D6873E7|nr:histidine kinase [Nocardioides speluncae]